MKYFASNTGSPESGADHQISEIGKITSFFNISRNLNQYIEDIAFCFSNDIAQPMLFAIYCDLQVLN